MTDTSQSGFMAISPSRPGGPYYIKKVVKNDKGQLVTVTVDAATGQQLQSTTGYNELTNQNYTQPNTISPTEEPKDEQKTTSEQILNPNDSDPYSETGVARSSNRTASDNFGYYDKPGWMKYSTLAPGFIGMAGKAANLAVNANNLEAVNSARSMLGLETVDTWDSLKSLVSDNKGQVADVTIGEENYSVGLEAQDELGRTNLTPNEARQRSHFMGAIEETPEDQVKADEKQFSQENPEAQDKGLFDYVRSFVDDIFGTEDTQEADTESYPDAPASPTYDQVSDAVQADEDPYDGTSYTGENQGYDSPSETSGVGRGSGMSNDNDSYSGAGLY